MATYRNRHLLIAVALAAMLAAANFSAPPRAWAASAPQQQDYSSAQAAVDALVHALQQQGASEKQQGTSEFAAVMGPAGSKLLQSGDAVADATVRKQFLDAYAEKHSLVPQGQGRLALSIGNNDWQMPIPLVEANGKWRFDTAAGAQAIVDRRIGRNEIAAIRTALAFADAENDYKARTGVYAQRLLSTAGNRDGLYWEAAPGELESPLGPLVDQARDEGYPGTVVAGRPQPYHGYFLRVLKGQGSSATGGARSYIKNGSMSEGAALLAWPAIYGASGVMTFEVDQEGVVFQKDFGPDTPARAAAIARFDPDLSWARVDVTP